MIESSLIKQRDALLMKEEMDPMDSINSMIGSIGFAEALDNYRENIKESEDVQEKLDYAYYLLECSENLEKDPKLLGVQLAESATSANEDKMRILRMRTVLEKEAISVLRRLAATSRSHMPLPEAQFALAELYGKGCLLLAVNHETAFKLYTQASKQNHPTAAFRCGVCHEVGAGTKKDYFRAMQFYRKAAAIGDNLAMHKLGLILLYGKLNQPKKLKEGIMWLKRASNFASRNHPESLHDLAQCYESRGGCPVLIADDGYAFELYGKAAHYGFAPSQCRLGSCYEFGLLGCPIDAHSSIKWYSKAAEQGFADAELALSSWYLHGSTDVLKASEKEAFLWAKRSAEKGHKKAQYQLGSFYENGIGTTVDNVLAIDWYKKSAKQGYKRASQRIQDLKRSMQNNSRQCILM